MYKKKKMYREELMDFIEKAQKDPRFIREIKEFIKVSTNPYKLKARSKLPQ